MKVRSQIYLTKRDGGVYYFRRTIPKDLQAILGRKAWWFSLETKHASTAKALAEQHTVRTSAELEEARIRLASSGTISDDQAEHLVAQMLASRLGADEASRVAGDYEDDAGYERHLNVLAEVEQATTAAVARGQVNGVEAQARDWLEGRGFKLEPEPFRRFVLRFAKALARSSEAMRARDAGKAVDTPAAPEGRNAPPTQLIDKWATAKGVRPKSADEARAALGRFTTLVGDLLLPWQFR